MEVAMTNGREQPASVEPKNGARFVVDETYLRKQASEAVALFLTPLSGVFGALFGNKARDRTHNKAA